MMLFFSGMLMGATIGAAAMALLFATLTFAAREPETERRADDDALGV
jgi:gas vesicle protein